MMGPKATVSTGGSRAGHEVCRGICLCSREEPAMVELDKRLKGIMHVGIPSTFKCFSFPPLFSIRACFLTYASVYLSACLSTFGLGLNLSYMFVILFLCVALLLLVFACLCAPARDKIAQLTAHIAFKDEWIWSCVARSTS